MCVQAPGERRKSSVTQWNAEDFRVNDDQVLFSRRLREAGATTAQQVFVLASEQIARTLGTTVEDLQS